MSVDPCDNFYEFACGNFDNFPADYAQFVRRYFDYPPSTMYNKIYRSLVKRHPLDLPKQFHFLGNYINSCGMLNFNNNNKYPGIKANKLNVLTEVISKLGEWPVVEGSEWNGTNFDWMSFNNKVGNLGTDEQLFLHLHISLQHRGKQYSINNEINAYHQYMVGVAKLLGANETHAIIELKKSLEFELKLINISNKNDIATKNVDDASKMSLKEIKEKWPGIKWNKLITTTIESQEKFYYPNETMIFIEIHHYITELEKLMKETPKRVQANYAVWKIIQSLIPMVESAI